MSGSSGVADVHTRLAHLAIECQAATPGRRAELLAEVDVLCREIRDGYLENRNAGMDVTEEAS